MSNRTITMSYTLKDAITKELLEKSSEPTMFVSGLGQILKKLEEEVLLLDSGSSKTILILAKDGLGEYDASAIQSLPKEQFAGIDLIEGMELFGESEDGQNVRVIVKGIGEDEVMVDFNHPFAGKDLEFEVDMLENRESTQDEIKSGMPEGAAKHSCKCGHSHDKEDHECCGGHGNGECGHSHDEEDHECCGGHGNGECHQ
ncbi:MAG: peptidylprolyl isomerase [Campylobacter sp.]|nr:peptidylprolyl isomerase [Campylobacter sp.]